MLGDGLSPGAVTEHAPKLLAAFQPHAARLGLKLGSIVLAEGARVALGDEVGLLTGARAVAVLIGERPGLSCAASLGVYLTYQPRAGRTDAERNCISNIHLGGLPPDAAAFKLAWLLDVAFTRGLTGVALKDDSDADLAVSAGEILPASTGRDISDLEPVASAVRSTARRRGS
jgi:ethanolamine ammonia-lyase small subunit